VQDPRLEEFSAAANFFMEEWPTVLRPWGFTRTAGKIHGLLLVSPNPMTTDEMLASTGASRGGLSDQLKVLINAGLVERLRILGQRQDQYVAVQDGLLIQQALTSHWKAITLQPMQLMEASLAAIADKSDLHWLEAINRLRLALKTGPQLDHRTN